MSDNNFLISNFTEGPVLTTDEFPPDLDTTSIGLMITQPDDQVFDSVMNEMLEYTNSDSITMVSRSQHSISRSTDAEPLTADIL